MKIQKGLPGLILVGGLWGALAVSGMFKAPDAYSLSERRPLAQMPPVTAESVLTGSFVSDFETYALDQFPLRDPLRTLKAVTAFYAMGKKDNNDIYLANGYAAKLEYPLNEESVAGAADKLNALYDTYIKDKGGKVYLAVAPDKGYYLGEANGFPAMDYERMIAILSEKMPQATYIDLFDTLSVEDYYKTDTHWRQEKLLSASRVLTEAMGVRGLEEDYTVVTPETPFYGVYYGQSALPLPAESISYISNEVLDSCIVTNIETGKSYTGMIDEEKISSKDPYEMFLSGASPLIVIENPKAVGDKELVIFRDSFGSSMAPLLVRDYKKVTLVDTRYIAPRLVGNFVDFEGAEVLFLYSTLILNQSAVLKD